LVEKQDILYSWGNERSSFLVGLLENEMKLKMPFGFKGEKFEDAIVYNS